MKYNTFILSPLLAFTLLIGQNDFIEIPHTQTKVPLPFNSHKAVINTKLLTFREIISNALNPSILEQEDGYLLVFRHDTEKKLCEQCGLTKNEIKMVHLDKNFEQIDFAKTISPKGSYDPEDPRLHVWNNQLYVTYNDEPYEHKHTKKQRSTLLKRRMFIGKFDETRGTLSDIQQVPQATLQLTHREKNWMPFECQASEGSLNYIYSTYPHKIITMKNLQDQTTHAALPAVLPDVYQIWNKELWGEIKGGTPARLVDDVYITFFHAWKKCSYNANYCYVMGAYTFEAKPPFKILSITPEPILFEDMYAARHRANHVHVLYPSGFAIEKNKDKTILHVSCGENDTSTRIVSIDKDLLLQEMIPLADAKRFPKATTIQFKNVNAIDFAAIERSFNLQISPDIKRYYAEADYVDGWFDKRLIIVLRLIDEFQTKNNIKGNLGEIGVWQGKSFIPLLQLAKYDEKALAVDCFESFEFNRDNSGGAAGSFKIFTDNINKYCSSPQNLKVKAGDSLHLQSQDYLDAVENQKAFRIFSIDGCHEADTTEKDMQNAFESLVDGGVIIMDDYFHWCWPGVSEGVNSFMLKNIDGVKPFLIAWNKIFFAHPTYAQHYFDMLRNIFIPNDLTIQKFYGVKTLIYDPKP